MLLGLFAVLKVSVLLCIYVDTPFLNFHRFSGDTFFWIFGLGSSWSWFLSKFFSKILSLSRFESFTFDTCFQHSTSLPSNWNPTATKLVIGNVQVLVMFSPSTSCPAKKVFKPFHWSAGVDFWIAAFSSKVIVDTFWSLKRTSLWVSLDGFRPPCMQFKVVPWYIFASCFTTTCAPGFACRKAAWSSCIGSWGDAVVVCLCNWIHSRGVHVCVNCGFDDFLAQLPKEQYNFKGGTSKSKLRSAQTLSSTVECFAWGCGHPERRHRMSA